MSEQPHQRIAGRLLQANGPLSGPDVALELAGGRLIAVNTTPRSGNVERILMPPLGNAHDHVRGVRPTSLGAFDLPLELWLLDMSATPRVDPYLVALTALGRQVRGGIGAIMVHYTRPQDPAHLDQELDTVARAASDIGVRIAIAAALRDRNRLGYRADERQLDTLSPAEREFVRGKMFTAPPSADEQIRVVEDLAARIDNPLVTVQYGPYGLEWCSESLLQRIAERSALTGRRVHMHLLESRLQREYLDSLYPQGPVRFLDEIGLLSPRLSIGHGVWLRPDEMELLAERRVTISINASSNLTIRSGIAAVPTLHKQGVPLAMGLDGFTVDDDDDGFRELRLNYLLHRGVALDDGIPLGAWLKAACHGGRTVVTGEEWSLAAGAPADVLTLDYTAMAEDVIVPIEEAHIIAHRATREHILSMSVAGREIVRDGRLTRVDLDAAQAELDAQVRHGAPEFQSWLAISAKLRESLGAFYAAGLHRCG